MDNAYFLYEAMNEFRKAQIANRAKYLEKKKSLDRYTGSVGYADDLKKIQDEREKANASARAACAEKIGPIFKAMYEANAKRRITAPSEEAVRILTVVSMMKKPSKEYLQFVAQSLDGNALALAALHDIAKSAYQDEPTAEERFVPDYTSMAATEMSGPAVVEAIKLLQKQCKDILDGTGANRVRTFTAELNKIRHGGQYDPDEFPQETEYTCQKDFYNRELKLGEDAYDLFIQAVNNA